jgi:hypothetical protein
MDAAVVEAVDRHRAIEAAEEELRVRKIELTLMLCRLTDEQLRVFCQETGQV